MKGYIYKLYAGADPSTGWTFNDPIFGKYATLGACMPNIRKFVDVGDWVFAISGKTPMVVPYVIGGFQVDEKIDALEAHARFPEYRLQKNESGQIIGNIIADDKGNHHPMDDHTNFDSRRQNYLVGTKSVFFDREKQIDLARQRSLGIMEGILNLKANRVSDLVPRWRRLDSSQVNSLVEQLRKIESEK